MRLLAILAAAMVTAAGFATALLIRADGPSPRQAKSHVAETAARSNAQVRPQATVSRVSLGIISYNLSLFVRETRIHPALTAKYIGWGTPFPAAEVQADHALGATTVIVLEPQGVSPRSIAAGHENAYLAGWAKAERKLDLPVIVSFAPEANGNWYPWGKGHISAALYKKMYRKVHNVLFRDGARRITWLWQVDRTSRKTERLSLLWPGRTYVSEVGIDGQLGTKTSTFYTVFAPTLAQIRRFTRIPVMLSEVAVAQEPARATQITRLFSAAHKERLTALDFFDVKTWNFDHDRAVLNALRAATRAK